MVEVPPRALPGATLNPDIPIEGVDNPSSQVTMQPFGTFVGFGPRRLVSVDRAGEVQPAGWSLEFGLALWIEQSSF
jgi:hypothetical protein